MTFLSELVTRAWPGLESPSTPITGATVANLLEAGSGTSSGVSVTPEGALRVGAALRGTQIIAGSIAGLPLKVYGAGGAEQRVPYINGHDDYLTAYERWETVVAHMVLWGNAYLFKVRGPRQVVTRLVPVHPSRVDVKVVDERELGGLVRQYVVDGTRPLTSYDILHVPSMSLDGIKGIGPITAAREVFGVALSAEHAAAKLFDQGLMLRGALVSEGEITQKQALRLKRKWRATMQGASHAGDIGVLDNDVKFLPMSMPAKDAQFLEARKFQVTEIARLLGIPGWMLNDQEKSTSWGTGMEQQFTTWVTVTLRSYLQRIEQRITHHLLSPTGQQYAEFKVEGLLRGDSAARAAFYNAGITGGWLVPNEPRGWENLAPVAWGDEPYLPNNTSAEAQASTAPAEAG